MCRETGEEDFDVITPCVQVFFAACCPLCSACFWGDVFFLVVVFLSMGVHNYVHARAVLRTVSGVGGAAAAAYGDSRTGIIMIT